MAGITSSGTSPLSLRRSSALPPAGGPLPTPESRRTEDIQNDRFRRVPGIKTRIILPAGTTLSDQARAIILGVASHPAIGGDGGSIAGDLPAVSTSHPSVVKSKPLMAGESGARVDIDDRLAPRFDLKKLRTNYDRRTASMRHYEWYVESGGKTFMTHLEARLKRLAGELTELSKAFKSGDAKKVDKLAKSSKLTAIAQPDRCGRDVAAARVRAARECVASARREAKTEVLFAGRFGNVSAVLNYYRELERKHSENAADKSAALKDRAADGAVAAVYRRIAGEVVDWIQYVRGLKKYRGRNFGAAEYWERWRHRSKKAKQIASGRRKKAAE